MIAVNKYNILSCELPLHNGPAQADNICRNSFRELPLTGVLPSRDSKIRGAIVRMAKTNAILKRPLNKPFSLKIHIKNQRNGYGRGTKVKARSSCNW